MILRRLTIPLFMAAALLLAACQTTSPEETRATPIPPATATQTAIPPTETPTATEVPTGPCDNPLMPLNIGNWWEYHATSALGSSDAAVQVVDWNEEFGINAIIEMTDMGSGQVDTDWVTCKDGGVIEDFPLFFISLQMADYLDGVLNTYYQSGIYSPSYAELNGNGWNLTWDAEYQTEESACFSKIVPDTSLCINRNSPIWLSFETQGDYEAVSVPAGDFPQTVKVTFSFKMATTLNFPGLTTSAPMTVVLEQWYAPYLGLVRSEVSSANFEITTGQPSSMKVESVVELTAYNIKP